jgi:hypothetical protein
LGKFREIKKERKKRGGDRIKLNDGLLCKIIVVPDYLKIK